MCRRAAANSIRRLMTWSVILGILTGVDARSAHLANCTKPADLCGLPAAPVDDRVDPCCDGSTVAPGEPDVCLTFDDCGCCSHSPAGHLGELDGRTLASETTGDLDLALASLRLPAPSTPVIAPARAIPTTDRPLPAADLTLLLGRLLI